jgi:hypothetical protein
MSKTIRPSGEATSIAATGNASNKLSHALRIVNLRALLLFSDIGVIVAIGRISKARLQTYSSPVMP